MKLNKIYEKHTKQKIDVIRKTLERDYFMTADEAKKFGVETQALNIHGLSFDLDDIDDWNYLIATNKSLLNKLD